MRITIRHTQDCPNVTTAELRVREALGERAKQAEIGYEPVATAADAERLRFVGSPTILIDGCDPFAAQGGSVGLACRLYPTPSGLAGTPTVEQLREAVERASSRTTAPAARASGRRAAPTDEHS